MVWALTTTIMRYRTTWLMMSSLSQAVKKGNSLMVTETWTEESLTKGAPVFRTEFSRTMMVDKVSRIRWSTERV